MLRRLAWALEVSRHGECSTQRLLAFEDYVRRTSLKRALAVCFLTPIPAFLFVVLMEVLLPLEPPANGWDASPRVWIRVAICSGLMSFAAHNSMHEFIPELAIPRRKLIAPSILTGVIYTGILIGYSALWVYPIPFGVIQLGGVYSLISFLSFHVCVGSAPFASIENARLKQKHHILTLSWICVMSIMCPGYNARYMTQESTAQMFLMVFPTIIKSSLKATLARHCQAVGLDELVPEVAHFTVEIFHALYIAGTVQTAAAPVKTTGMIILLDMLPKLLSYYKVLRPQSTKSRPRQNVSPPGASPNAIAPAQNTPFTQKPEQPVSPNAIAPAPTSSLIPTSAPPVSLLPKQRSGSRDQARKPRPTTTKLRTQATLAKRRMLFTCEYHVIVEFIEVIIPLHYGIFMAVLYYLPDAKYYPHMRVLDSEHELLQVVLNILYVVSLELISLIGFCVLVQRKFDISCLYVLAFVLDTHAEMIQMRLLLLVPYIIFMPIEHAGVDYTFKFEWMHRQSNAV